MKTSLRSSMFAAVLLTTLSAGSSGIRAQEKPAYKIGVTQRAFSPVGSYYWRGAQTHALVTMIWYPAAANAVDRDVVHAEAVRLAVNFFAAKLK